MVIPKQLPKSAALRAWVFAGTILLCSALVAPKEVWAAPAAASQDWSADMAKYAEEDAKSPAPDGCVLFVGSSSIRRWETLAADFPEVPVLNRGFGGSHISDSIVHFDRLVAPHNPRTIVFYAGTNDIAAGKSPEEVAADFREFCSMVHAAKPTARVLFISLQFAPSRWNLREKMALTNAYVAAFCSADPRRTYVDTNNVTMTSDGRPRPELYVEDQLHMNPAGYAIWTELLRPLVQPKVTAR